MCSFPLPHNGRACYACRDSIDWDLQLVRVETKDTCSQWNSSISWEDSQYLEHSETPIILPDDFHILPREQYPPEEISGLVPKGTYRLYVSNYVHHGMRGISGYPSVTLFLKSSGPAGDTCSVQHLSCESPVAPGEKAFMGTLTSSAMTFDAAENVIVERAMITFDYCRSKPIK